MAFPTVSVWFPCTCGTTLASDGARGSVLERPLNKEGTELREFDARMPCSVGQKTPVRHAGNGVGLEHHGSAIFLDDEVRARDTPASEGLMGGNAKIFGPFIDCLVETGGDDVV